MLGAGVGAKFMKKINKTSIKATMKQNNYKEIKKNDTHLSSCDRSIANVSVNRAIETSIRVQSTIQIDPTIVRTRFLRLRLRGL